jgi:hypothetical protein
MGQDFLTKLKHFEAGTVEITPVKINLLNKDFKKRKLALGRIKKVYKLTEQQHSDLIAGGCELCGSKELFSKSGHTNLVIDHNHNTGLEWL